MDTTFGELKQKILRLVGDDPIVPGSGDTFKVYGAQFTAELLEDSVHAALDAICNRYPKSSVFQIDGGDITVDLPADLIEVEGVLLDTGYMIPQIQLIARSLPLGNESNAWDTYTEGSITLQIALDTASTALVYYSATWAYPVDDDDALEPPRFLVTPLALYAAHYAIFYGASQTGTLSQYKTKVDSGQPTDNPLMDLANFFLKHYEIELQRVPMKPKGTKA